MKTSIIWKDVLIEDVRILLSESPILIQETKEAMEYGLAKTLGVLFKENKIVGIKSLDWKVTPNSMSLYFKYTERINEENLCQ